MTSYGYFLSGEELGPNEIVRYGQAAERAGFDRLWVSDHIHPWLSDQDSSPFVWSVLGALAATTQVHLTTAVTCPTFRFHPALIAQAAATVATMAPGRFSLGVGTGEALNEHVFGEAWPPVSIRQDRLREALALIRKLWTGEVTTHLGEHYTVHDLKLWTLPEQLPDILVSGFGDSSVKLAAEIGDGFMNVKPDPEAISTYRAAGGKGITQVGTKFCWAETEQEAAETAHRLWGHDGVEGQTMQDCPMWFQFEQIRDLRTPEDVAAAVPCGPDAQKLADVILEHAKAGYDEVYVSQMGPDQEGGLRFLQEEVMPLVEKASA